MLRTYCRSRQSRYHQHELLLSPPGKVLVLRFQCSVPLNLRSRGKNSWSWQDKRSCIPHAWTSTIEVDKVDKNNSFFHFKASVLFFFCFVQDVFSGAYSTMLIRGKGDAIEDHVSLISDVRLSQSILSTPRIKKAPERFSLRRNILQDTEDSFSDLLQLPLRIFLSALRRTL